MDAQFTKKAFSGFVALLMVASVVFVAAPAVAQTPNPTNARDVTVDGERTVDTPSPGSVEPDAAKNVTAGGPIEFEDTVDLTITNITITGSRGVGAEFGIWPPTWSDAMDNRTAYADGAHGDGTTHLNVTFPAQMFNLVGIWSVRGPDDFRVNFTVEPKTNLQVTLSQNTFTYTEAFTTFTVTVVNLSNGAAAADIPLTFDIPNPPTGAKTNANGVYVFSGFIGAAGSFKVTASKDIGGSPDAEFRGEATFTVAAASLSVTGLNTTILHGFDKEATWGITYPNNATGVLAAPSFQRYNLTVTLPNGSKLYVNATSVDDANASDPEGPALFQNGTAGDLDYSVVIGNTYSWWYNGQGNFYFRPAGNWQVGTYTFSLNVNTKFRATGDCAACLQYPEFAATWTLTTAAPQNVNVVVKEGASEVTELEVRATSGLPASPVAGSYTIVLNVEGDVKGQFPGNYPVDSIAFPASNITVTGSVLPGWSVAAYPGHGAGAGVFTISNVVPTQVGGSVSFHIGWKNATTTVTLPITKGAKSTADVTQIVVDQVSTITVTLRDKFDNTVPSGQVFLFEELTGLYPGLGEQSVNGTGAPGLGQNGQYSFNVKPTAVGNLTVYGIIGTNQGGINNQNFTYLSIRVVPAHDISVTLSATETMASRTTHVFLNATTPNGVGVPITSYRAYFLTEAQKNELTANGSSTLPAFTPGLGGDTQSSATNGTNVRLDSHSATGVNVNVTLGAGTYYVYVCSEWGTPADCNSAKHDNLGNLPTFTVHPYRVTFSPSRIADNRDIQADTTVNVTVADKDGNPVNGTLKADDFALAAASLFSADPNVTLSGVTLAVVDGKTSFVATGKAAGNLWFAFNPEGGHVTHASRGDTVFQVVGPDVTVSPERVPVGNPASLTITVRSLDGTPLAGKVVRVCGSPIGGSSTAPATITDATTGCTGSVTTDSNGVARVGVLPTATGDLFLYVNNTRTSTTVPVFAGLIVTWAPSSPEAGDTVTITVIQPGRGGESGVNVTVTVNGTAIVNAATPSNGMVVVPNVAQGDYVVTASKAGFETATETFTVGPRAPTPPPAAARFELSNLVAPTTGTVGEAMAVSADVENVGNADGTATLLLLVNGRITNTLSVPVNAGASESVGFTFTPTASGSFRVTVKLSTGQTLTEQTVTVTTPTPTPAPTPTPSPSPSPTPAPTPTDEPTGVPGFGVAALVVALGIAVLAFRRRQ